MIISSKTRKHVEDAAIALRRVRGRSTVAERRALAAVLTAAQAEIDAAVAREYPAMLQWRIPAPSIYCRWVGDDDSGGWRAWRSAGQLSRAAQAYGLGATLGHESDPSLALRDYT